MNFNCPRCGAVNQAPTNFCRNCGLQFVTPQPQYQQPQYQQAHYQQPPAQQPKRKNDKLAIALALLFGMPILCCAISGINSKQSKVEVSNSNQKNAALQTVAPTPAQKPDQTLAEAKKALNDGFNEKNGAYGKIVVAKPLLQSITSDQKEYKEAQTLLKEVARREVLIDKMAGRVARRIVVEQMEKKMLSEGMDFEFTTSGPDEDILRVKYVLMSRPLVYKVTNETEFLQNMRIGGFKKVTFTDGYDDSWTFDLTK